MILPLLAEISGSIHVGLAALGAAVGVGLIGMGAASAVGRNPGAATPILVQAILAIAFAEAIVFYALFLAFVAVLWWGGAARMWKGLAVSVVFFALPLVPWHIAAWQSVRRFNTEPSPDDPSQSVVRRVAESLSWMPWDEAARAERARLPAFARDAASAFVAATVLHRGGGEVRGEDLRILDEAFGYRPRPLGTAPFVSLYGPLNFALANHPRAHGGFTRAALEDPPPLTADPGRYPPMLVQGLPPPDLSFVYPPHVRLVNEGYAMGWRWLRARGPAGALAHAGRKLRVFGSGAALGFSGFDLPLGLPRWRGAMDLAVPDRGWRTAAWSSVLVIACGLGLAAGWRRPALYPWVLFLVSKVAVTVAFFGYARQGAAVFPVVALLAALAAARWAPNAGGWSPGRVARGAALVMLAALAVEGFRAVHPPALRLDGRPLEAGDSADVHRDQTIDTR
jgi:F-type H+-transporting ATPase subunit c